MPLLKSGAKTLGREALKTGLNIAGDVVQGQNLKQAAKTRLKTTGHRMLQRDLAQSRPPDERTIKRNARQKNPDVRPDNGTHRETSSDFGNKKD